MTTARGLRARYADLADGDLVCWNCKERLIAGYAGLIAEAGPVPFFGEMTLVCNKCSSANRSPCTSSARTIAADEAVPSAKKANRSATAQKDGGNGP